ncbi:response regulator receiver protein [Flexistipes sinusarabici DSM 4947]|uniref:Response regulator receiver protein n=2 Tax=Flexistipes sinusarabici TaxID=2352 RepID=F8E868_FLESM|nr:response regulator [Flexistipes sinusarabici]AEI13992.1 response regulator receiver protein [Flexistipes sinusarabici DSM 4947]HCW93551.1 response regulator [Flexistipes sinusarabici]
MSDKNDFSVLVVDDEEHTRLGYAEVLRIDGYDVDVAQNGAEGLKKAERKEYHVIVTDLRMPEMDGMTFIEKLRNFDPEARVIVITAFGTFKTYKKTKEMGVVSFLNKPVRARDLKEAVAEILKK